MYSGCYKIKCEVILSSVKRNVCTIYQLNSPIMIFLSPICGVYILSDSCILFKVVCHCFLILSREFQILVDSIRISSEEWNTSNSESCVSDCIGTTKSKNRSLKCL